MNIYHIIYKLYYIIYNYIIKRKNSPIVYELKNLQEKSIGK